MGLNTFTWQAPVAMPTEGMWSWDEAAGNWVAVETPA